ncbi:MAG: phage/plasmid primase, P4 family [Candidatus Brocadiaceae bacterium]|nr:phage/plasmid primase, P4 family [Candidatus Brocadiaceae bacterium]
MDEKQVSYFKNHTTTTPIKKITIAEYIDIVRSGKYSGIGLDKDKLKSLKKQTPCVTVSGVFSRRNKEGLLQHSGLLALDVDKFGDDIEKVKKAISEDRYTFAVFKSLSGQGLVSIVRINPEFHQQSHDAFVKYYHERFGLTIETAGNIDRLRYLSADSEPFTNNNSDVYILEHKEDNEDNIVVTKTKNKDTSISNKGFCMQVLRAAGVTLEGGNRGSHPVHGSDTNNNFHVDEDKNLWHCFRCNTGGDALSLIAVLERIIDCREAVPGVLRGALFSKVVKVAREKYGFLEAEQRIELGVDQNEKKLIEKYGEPYYTILRKDGPVVTGVNENYFAAEHAQQNVELFDPLEQSFYRYHADTGLYVEVSKDVIKKEISKNLLDMSRIRGIKRLEELRKDRVLNSVANLLRGLIEQKQAFNKDSKRFVHVKNGVLEMSADGIFTLKPFSPDYQSRNQSPIAYDQKAECPKFLNELLCPAVRPEDIELIQKYAGQCILGYNVTQRFLILDGNAGTGKSTLVNILQRIIGMENTTQLRVQHLLERFELYRFLGKSLLIGTDVPGDFLSQKPASVIKGLVGGDGLTGEKKGENATFHIPGNFNIMMTSNSRLRINLDGDTGAWKRRLLVVRYERPPVKKKVPAFDKRLLEEESSGILNWCLKGVEMLFRDVDKYGDICLAGNQTSIVDSLLAESDSVRHFLSDCVRPGRTDLTTDEIVEAYAKYCPGKGWNSKSVISIYRELPSLILELFRKTQSRSVRREGKSQRGYRGLVLLTEEDIGEDTDNDIIPEASQIPEASKTSQGKNIGGLEWTNRNSTEKDILEAIDA